MKSLNLFMSYIGMTINIYCNDLGQPLAHGQMQTRSSDFTLSSLPALIRSGSANTDTGSSVLKPLTDSPCFLYWDNRQRLIKPIQLFINELSRLIFPDLNNGFRFLERFVGYKT